MQFNSLKRKSPRGVHRQIGRGGKRGKTSGRGGKGQTARAGAKMRPEFRDTIKRLPKLRGRGKNIFQSFQVPHLAINLSQLETEFKSGAKVNPQTIVASGLVAIYKGRKPQIKILGGGELTKKLEVSGCRVSAQARVKIEKAGGKVK